MRRTIGVNMFERLVTAQSWFVRDHAMAPQLIATNGAFLRRLL